MLFDSFLHQNKVKNKIRGHIWNHHEKAHQTIGNLTSVLKTIAPHMWLDCLPTARTGVDRLGRGAVGGVTPLQSSKIFVFFSKIQKFSCVLLEKIMVHPPKNSQQLISTPKKIQYAPPMLIGSGHPWTNKTNSRFSFHNNLLFS